MKRFGSQYDALIVNEEASAYNSLQLQKFAKAQLLNGPTYLNDIKGLGTLACLTVRFALELDFRDNSGREVALTLIKHHMLLCVAASPGFDKFITAAGSEPYLAEAARELMWDAGAAQLLAENSNLSCVDCGQGELVAALLVMRARDASANVVGSHRVVSVNDLMRSLLPVPAYETLIRSIAGLAKTSRFSRHSRVTAPGSTTSSKSNKLT